MDPEPSTSRLLQTLAERVESALQGYLQLPRECPERLRAAMEYSLLAGGKRLRPGLALLACRACGGDEARAMPAACAIEMIHTYSLIHDDLPAMDDDDLRRGRPTCHKQFDDATAILAGDGLLTLAFEVVARDIRPADVAAACCVDLANAAGVVGMVGGQMADLEAERQPSPLSPESVPESTLRPIGGEGPGVRGDNHAALQNLESIHRRKTGRLLSCALTLGGRVAGATPESLRRLENYGRHVGLAFQIADDLLDVLGDEGKMGKGTRKDAGRGKLTYPGLLGEAGSRAKAEALVAQACAELEVFGERARELQALARYVIERDR
jgi:geranylgeranyl diphosphate synthase type II